MVVFSFAFPLTLSLSPKGRGDPSLNPVQDGRYLHAYPLSPSGGEGRGEGAIRYRNRMSRPTMR